MNVDQFKQIAWMDVIQTPLGYSQQAYNQLTQMILEFELIAYYQNPLKFDMID